MRDWLLAAAVALSLLASCASLLTAWEFRSRIHTLFCVEDPATWRQ